MRKILIVEDDATIVRVVAEELENWGYTVKQVEDFSAVMETFRAFSPHLVLMDLSLPHRSGFYWCGEIRRESTAPIIFLSSAGDNMNQVTALHQGADDFIPKPFDLSLLAAKVGSVLRRSYEFAPAEEMPAYGGAVLDVGEMALLTDGKRVELTRNEFRILRQLMEAKGRVVPREAIMRQLWEDENFIDDNTLTVNVNRLRKKLDEVGLMGFIATRKGAGYCVSGE